MSEHQAWKRNGNWDRNNQAISSIIVLSEMSRNLCGYNILSNHYQTKPFYSPSPSFISLKSEFCKLLPALKHQSWRCILEWHQYSWSRWEMPISRTTRQWQITQNVQEPLAEYKSACFWLPSSWTRQQSPTIIRCIQPSLLPGATAQSSSKSCVEITRTKEAAGGSTWLHHIFPQSNLLCSYEEENLIWLQTNINRGDGMWSQAERLSWIIYGSQWMDNFPKLITLQPELFLLLQEQQSTSALASQDGKHWIAREIVSLVLRGLFILFWSIYQYNQEALGKESLFLPDTAMLWGFEDALLCRALQEGDFCLS